MRKPPEGGWPLDDLLVGVATLRTLRELLQQGQEDPGCAPRAWDIALQNGVTVPGAGQALDRMERLGLVVACSSQKAWRAPGYRTDPWHPLLPPLRGLFAAEKRMARERSR